MKDSTRNITLWIRIMLVSSALFLFHGVIFAQTVVNTSDSVMYGDTIFLQDFGSCTKTTCNYSFTDLGGLDSIGSTYKYTGTGSIPNDGYYAIVRNWKDMVSDTTSSSFYLTNIWQDHSGLSNDSTSPHSPSLTGGDRTSSNGMMLFVNCGGPRGVVYKRQVTELCRAAQFEFSAWVASVHHSTNGAKLRFELWSADPGNDVTDAPDAQAGEIVPNANGATLLAASSIFTLPNRATWYQMKIIFRLLNQDHVWVVLRNYGNSGGGNDIVVDDIVFRPYAPFNLQINIDTNAVNTACKDGLVTLFASFETGKNTLPDYVTISEYGFYFEGYRNGVWVRLGSSTPLQTQSASEPLELTLPLSEYNLYSKFRIAVATTPSGFGGKCITFANPSANKVQVAGAPQFTISGDDICADDKTPSDITGTFVIKNTNQTSKGGWQVKVRLSDGTVKTLTPNATTCP